VPTNGGYTISCVDGTTSSQQSPFFTITGTINNTYTTSVYSGEIVLFNDNFVVNGVYHPGAIATVKINGTVVLTTPPNEDGGFHSISVN